MGRHDGITHGGLWHESPVELYDASELAQARSSSQQPRDDLVVKGEKVNFDYWKRSVSILEDQIRVRRCTPWLGLGLGLGLRLGLGLGLG